MEVRPIDGNILRKWCEKIIDQACHPATVQIGEVFLAKVRSMPTLTPPNEPLTLDELREMDGEPVWVVCNNEFEPLVFWALVEVCEESIFLTNNLGGRTEYATDVEFEDDGVIVYRHKPEEGA